MSGAGTTRPVRRAASTPSGDRLRPSRRRTRPHRSPLGGPGTQPSRARAKLASLGAGEAREGSTQERKEHDERLVAQRHEPLVDEPPECVVVEEQLAAPGEEAFDPGGRARRILGDRQRPGEAASRVFVVEDSGVEEQPRATAGDDTMYLLGIGDPLNGVAPERRLLVALEERDGALHRLDT